jgi:hypothetical protein
MTKFTTQILEVLVVTDIRNIYHLYIVWKVTVGMYKTVNLLPLMTLKPVS